MPKLSLLVLSCLVVHHGHGTDICGDIAMVTRSVNGRVFLSLDAKFWILKAGDRLADDSATYLYTIDRKMARVDVAFWLDMADHENCDQVAMTRGVEYLVAIQRAPPVVKAVRVAPLGDRHSHVTAFQPRPDHSLFTLMEALANKTNQLATVATRKFFKHSYEARLQRRFVTTDHDGRLQIWLCLNQYPNGYKNPVPLWKPLRMNDEVFFEDYFDLGRNQGEALMSMWFEPGGDRYVVVTEDGRLFQCFLIVDDDKQRIEAEKKGTPEQCQMVADNLELYLTGDLQIECRASTTSPVNQTSTLESSVARNPTTVKEPPSEKSGMSPLLIALLVVVGLLCLAAIAFCVRVLFQLRRKKSAFESEVVSEMSSETDSAGTSPFSLNSPTSGTGSGSTSSVPSVTELRIEKQPLLKPAQAKKALKG